MAQLAKQRPRHSGNRMAHESRQAAKHWPQRALQAQRCNPVCVTAKQFVSALAHLHHFGAGLARQLADIMHRNTNRVRDRLVLVINHVRQKAHEILTPDDHLVMLGAKLTRSRARKVELVVLLHPGTRIADGEGTHRLL